MITEIRGDVKVIRLKSCPRCKTGDIIIDRDHHGWYESCIQCGYICDLIPVSELVKKQGSDFKKCVSLPSRADYKHT
jgi:ribosomal protein S27AE